MEKELNFMDMSKDISLVNSDNESSVTTNINDEETTPRLEDLVMDLQNQLASKSQSVLALEEELLSHKKKIISLESSSQDLQKIIDGCKEKIDLLDSENSLLKSTTEALNSTIKSQKSNLESAYNDIESYNSLIQELQIKLSNKEKIKNLNINDNTLEKMIANEEKFIANNENMRNIIHSFQIAVETRNKEIETLKSAVEKNFISPDINAFQEQLTLKEQQIEAMSEEAKRLQDQINDNVYLINKLMQEKNNLTDLENKLTSQLTDITNKLTEQEKNNKAKDININDLKECNEKLIISMTEKDNTEKELLSKHADMSKIVHTLNEKVLKLEEDIRVKDNLIISLNTQDTHTQEYIFVANSVLNVLTCIISKLTGNTQDLPNAYDNLGDILSSLKNKLNILESTVIEISTQKDLEIENMITLNSELEKTNKKLLEQVENLKLNTEEIHKTKHELMQVLTECDNLRKELQYKNTVNSDLELKLNEISEINKNLYNDISSKEHTIQSLKEIENSLHLDIDKLRQERNEKYDELRLQMENLNKDYLEKQNNIHLLLEEKETKIHNIETIVTKLKKCLYGKSSKIENLHEQVSSIIDSKNTMLKDIFQKVIVVKDILNIKCSFQQNNDNTCDNILLVLNNMATYLNNRKNDDNANIDQLIESRNTHIEQNNELLKNLNEKDAINKSLMTKLEEIQLENKILNEELSQGNEKLEVLKMELSQKSNEIEVMVIKTQELKDHFNDFDFIIKNLQADNEKLTTRCSELELITNGRDNDIDSDIDSDANATEKSLCGSEPKVENNSPPSLLTICCNKIVETIQPPEKSESTSGFNTSIEYQDRETQSTKCGCDVLLADLKSAQIEISNLSKTIQQLETLNQSLISEQEQVRQEVELLLEPAFELQKKINNHKTNLSTLTATTYAENKSLRSQVKVLQHHHSRFHQLCQRDLPVVKKQLFDLMTILKGDSTLIDKHNASFKRYSLPIVLPDSNSTLNNLNNESTLDGDLLMLDTNLTLTTSADGTLMGFDQTCLEMTQVYSNVDVGCQTHETTHVYVDNLPVATSDSDRQLYEKIESLETENNHLKEKINSGLLVRESTRQSDSKASPDVSQLCTECRDLKANQQLHAEEIMLLSQKINKLEAEKKEFENKYSNLSLEIPSTNALVKKITIFEKELHGRVQEIEKLTNTLSMRNQELKQLQEENDALSTQVMESVTETDDLNKELDVIKDANAKLADKCCGLEKLLQQSRDKDKEKENCPQCQARDDVMNSVQNIELHTKLNRSLSDSDTSSRYNKICTLQNELHAGREDCKQLTEEVAVIKNHLERSNLSMGQNMDLDDSMGESNIFSLTKHFDTVGTQFNKFSVPNNTHVSQSDNYTADKYDCINYFVEKTGIDKENLDSNIKIIDIMKMFYTNCIAKHSNEIENLINKIKCYEEAKIQLETHVNKLSTEYSDAIKKLEEKEHAFQTVANTLGQIRQNTILISEEVPNLTSSSVDTQFIASFKEKFLKITDNELGFNSVPIFDRLIDCVTRKHQNELTRIMNEYTNLQAQTDNMAAELNAVNENLIQMKAKLTEKENEYNLLKTQKEKIHEISNAVTLDIVQKERELYQAIVAGCQQLVDNNVMRPTDIDATLPASKNISLLFGRLINEIKIQAPEIEKEKEKLAIEIKKSKTELEENQKVLEMIKVENDKLKDINRTITMDLVKKDETLQIQYSMQEELSGKYQSLVEENKSVIALVDKTSEEIKALKKNILEKEIALQDIESNKTSYELLKHELASCKQEIDNLKTVNEIILKEKDTAVLQLEKSEELLRKNTTELDKMTADILVLRKSIEENVSMIESLKQEAKSLLEQNIQLKDQFEEKCRDCTRLAMNIKTHEKTAEIQSKMIMR